MPVSANLGTALEDYIASLVKTGRFGSRSEALQAGFRLMRAQQKRREALDNALATGRFDAKVKKIAIAEVTLRNRRAQLAEAMKAYRATSG